MLAPDDGRRLDGLIAVARDDAPAFARSVAALGNDSPSVEAFVDLGVPLSSASAHTESGLRALRKYRSKVAEDTGGGWMDNTTIVTAGALMSDGGPDAFSALTLWDLVTFFDAIIGFERIYHHEHPGVEDAEINRRLGGDVFKPIPLPVQGPAATYLLPDPWDGPHRFMCEVWDQGHSWLKGLSLNARSRNLKGLQLAAVRDAWALALDRPELTAEEMVDCEELSTSWVSPSDMLLKQMVDVTDVEDSAIWLDPGDRPREMTELRAEAGLPPMPGRRGRLLTELNLRSYTNQRIADFFGLAYVPGAGRVPFRKYLYDRAVAVQHRLAAVELLDESYTEIAGEVRLRLPVFLAIAVRQAAKPEALWEVLADLRDHASPYRQIRWNLDVALARGDLKEARRLAKALNTDVASVLAVAGDALAASSVAAIGELAKTGDLTGIATGIAAVQAGGSKLLDSSIADRLAWRLKRPHLLWINNVMDEAKHLTEALPDVARLWAVPELEKTRFAARFHKMGELTGEQPQ